MLDSLIINRSVNKTAAVGYLAAPGVIAEDSRPQPHFPELRIPQEGLYVSRNHGRTFWRLRLSMAASKDFVEFIRSVKPCS